VKKELGDIMMKCPLEVKDEINKVGQDLSVWVQKVHEKQKGLLPVV
jgi:hypothetical protein